MADDAVSVAGPPTSSPVVLVNAPLRGAGRHWSETLPPGNGRRPTSTVWMIPATIAAAAVAALTIRGWLG